MKTWPRGGEDGVKKHLIRPIAAKEQPMGPQQQYNGAPGMIRTPDLVVRSHALYPTELRAQCTVRQRRRRGIIWKPVGRVNWLCSFISHPAPVPWHKNPNRNISRERTNQAPLSRRRLQTRLRLNASFMAGGYSGSYLPSWLCLPSSAQPLIGPSSAPSKAEPGDCRRQSLVIVQQTNPLGSSH